MMMMMRIMKTNAHTGWVLRQAHIQAGGLTGGLATWGGGGIASNKYSKKQYVYGYRCMCFPRFPA